MLLMGKSTISMAIFHCFLYVHQRVCRTIVRGPSTLPTVSVFSCPGRLTLWYKTSAKISKDRGKNSKEWVNILSSILSCILSYIYIYIYIILHVYYYKCIYIYIITCLVELSGELGRHSCH